MDLNDYKQIVEDEFGPVVLPKNKSEVDKTIEFLMEELERPTWNDYHILQAIEIINDWWKKNECSRNESKSSD